MKVLRALAVATLAASLFAAGTPSPASADRWAGADGSKDVRQLTFSDEPQPCGTVEVAHAPQDATTDLLGLTVRHEGDMVGLRARVRDLSARADLHVNFDLVTDRRHWSVWTSQGEDGRFDARLMSAPDTTTQVGECGGYVIVLGIHPCDGLRVSASYGRDAVAVEVPRRCLADPRWVRAGAATSRFLGQRFRRDVWGVGRDEVTGVSGPFGPRVRRTP